MRRATPNPWNNNYKQEAAAYAAQQIVQAQRDKEAAAAAAKQAASPAILRIGFGTSASTSAAPSSFQSIASARHSPAAPFASRTPEGHSPARSTTTSVSNSSTTSVIQGIALSNAVPTPGTSTRSISPSPTSQSRPSGTSSSSAASSAVPTVSSSAASLINSHRPAFLKGGGGAGSGVGGKVDRTGKAKKRKQLEDEDEEEEFMKEDETGPDDDKRVSAASPSTSSSTSTSINKLPVSSAVPAPKKLSVASTSMSAAGKTNRMAKLRNKAAKQSKVRNSRGAVSNGGGAARAVKEEEEEAEEEAEDEATAEPPTVRIAISPSLNGINTDDDEREAPPESPPPFALSPHKQPLQNKRLQTLSASPTAASSAARSPLRSSTPDPTKKRKPSTTARSTSPLPLPVPSSPSAHAVSPSPIPLANSCARLRPWTNSHKVLVGNPCEKDMWKGSRRGDEDDSDSDSSDDEAEQQHRQQQLRAAQHARQQASSPAIFARPSPPHSAPATAPVSPSAAPPSPLAALPPSVPSVPQPFSPQMPPLEQSVASAAHEPTETAAIQPPPLTRRQSGRGQKKVKAEHRLSLYRPSQRRRRKGRKRTQRWQ